MKTITLQLPESVVMQVSRSWHFLKKVKAGIIVLEFHLQDNISAVQALISKYQDQDIGLADATIIRMSELLEDCHVYTTHRKDFRSYRRFGRAMIPHTAPDR